MLLKRVASTNFGVFGVLLEDGIPFAVSLENPWLENRANVSCIPAGDYVCQRIRSPRFGNTFQILRVPNRTHILFHKGNLTKDTLGCILVGEQYEFLHGKPAILRSGKGYGEFMQRLNGVRQFAISIRWT